MIKLNKRHKFDGRDEINKVFGGDTQKGIVKSTKTNAILLFFNVDDIYKDYFYPKNKYTYCMYTGIGTKGDQDAITNPMYDLNMAVLTHKATNKPLLLFEKKDNKYYFVGRYELIETHQNVQPDEDYSLRRVFVFHLHQISEEFQEK